MQSLLFTEIVAVRQIHLSLLREDTTNSVFDVDPMTLCSPIQYTILFSLSVCVWNSKTCVGKL